MADSTHHLNQAVNPKNSNFYKHAKNKKYFKWVVLLLIFILFIFLYFNFSKKNHAQPAQLVATAVATNKDVPIYLYALGLVSPANSVTVRTQVSGTLTKILFHEGQFVKAGEVLAEVDSRPFQAQLMQYQGQLQRDEALLTNANLDLARYQQLWQQDSISKQTLTAQESTVHQYEGAILVDKGLIQSTLINIAYCKITAPIAGRIGLSLVDPGNYIQTTDTNGLAVLTSLDPVSVLFTFPENDIPAILNNIDQQQAMQVEIYNKENTKLLGSGDLTSIDSQIDSTTGTVRLKALIDNKNKFLYAKQFVNVKLLLKTLRQVIVVPTSAIQINTNKNLVYVVDKNNIAHAQAIKIGENNGDETVITEGLEKDQIVITDGIDKINDGSKVSLLAKSVQSQKNI